MDLGEILSFEKKMVEYKAMVDQHVINEHSDCCNVLNLDQLLDRLALAHQVMPDIFNT